MRIFYRSLLIITSSLLCSSLISQENVTTVGFQVKPIIISDIGGAGPFEEANGPYRVKVQPKTGMSYGMVIRKGITKSISAEVGLNRVSRSYRYDFIDEETGFERPLDFKYINYEIPIKGLIFIQLGEDFYLNNSLGASIDLFASDVGSGDVDLEQITLRGQWAKIALEANLGVEYRTKKSGYFYFGTTFHNPFSAVARSSVRYRTSMSEEYVNFDLFAGYLTLDFKYYFHEEPVRR